MILDTDRWIYSKLQALGITAYYDHAPEDATYPLVVFSQVSGENVLGLCAVPVAVVEQWQIVVWSDKPAFAEGLAETIVSALKSDGNVAIAHTGTTRLVEEDARGIVLEYEIIRS